jgi:hypothetical protein
VTFDAIYSLDGEEFRVVVAGDVVALPYAGWSHHGYGDSIEAGWILGRPKGMGQLPGSPARRKLLARLVTRGLADAHGHAHHEGPEFRLVEIRRADVDEVPAGGVR